MPRSACNRCASETVCAPAAAGERCCDGVQRRTSRGTELAAVEGMSTPRTLLGSVCLCIITLVTACSRGPTEGMRMSIEDKRTKNEAMIRQLMDDLVAAIRAKNIDGVMAS